MGGDLHLFSPQGQGSGPSPGPWAGLPGEDAGAGQLVLELLPGEIRAGRTALRH